MRGYIPTVGLMLTMLFGATAAQAGIIVYDRNSSADDNNPCEEKDATDLLTDIVTGVAALAKGGIIVYDFAGSDNDDPNETCGIIVYD